MPFERTLDDAGPLPSRSSDNDGFRGWPSPAKIPNEKGFMGSDATPVGAGICGPDGTGLTPLDGDFGVRTRRKVDDRLRVGRSVVAIFEVSACS